MTRRAYLTDQIESAERDALTLANLHNFDGALEALRVADAFREVRGKMSVEEAREEV